MHVPDGFLNIPTSVTTGVIAAAGVGLALRGARRELDDRTAPMAGLVAAFIFAGQMINFPVAGGTSGHLLGGALAAVLVGPWTGVLCLSVVLLVQGLVMADGGLTALGTNITLMGLVGVGVGWLVFRLVRGVLPTRLSMVPVAAAIAALVSVPTAALGFTALFGFSQLSDQWFDVPPTAPVPLGTVASAMVGWHVLIGLGEALITGLVVRSVVSVRPDLVYGARPALAARAASPSSEVTA
ncbi:MAG: energy-coupling factor ABC transporter permease [Nocardioides sp.]|uniref:energy-coupling factor ABC transporter permease n=1 Tax=Nocardioides sp. TaxID=35761 RepID=UPI0039E5EE8D